MRTVRFAILVAVGLASAASVLVVGRASAQGSARDAGAPADGGAVREAGSSSARIPPDPPAMSERQQWVFDLRWDRGEVYLVAVHKQDMGAPHPTPRVMGRFALELFEGPTLIERVRFDFPLLGVGESAPDAGLQTPPRIEERLKTRIGVFFPATKRGTRLELWDRKSDVRWPLPWPPKEGLVAPPGSSSPPVPAPGPSGVGTPAPAPPAPGTRRGPASGATQPSGAKARDGGP